MYLMKKDKMIKEKNRYEDAIEYIERNLKDYDFSQIDSVLDCGVGKCDGINTFKKYGISEIKGIDLEDYTKMSKKELGIEIIKANVMDIPYKDNSFDLVCALHTLEHLSNKENLYIALNEISRVCKIDKFIIIASPMISTILSVNIIDIDGSIIARRGEPKILIDLKTMKKFLPNSELILSWIYKGKIQYALFRKIKDKEEML